MVGDIEDADRAPQGVFTHQGMNGSWKSLEVCKSKERKVGKRRLLGGPT